VKKDKNTIIKILFISLGVLLVAYFWFTLESPSRYLWKENYKASSDQPYGTKFIQKLLESYKPGEKFIFNDKTPLRQLLDSSRIKTKTDYVFIGSSIYLDSLDRHTLLKFIASGNNAFISTVYLPIYILDSVYINECDQQMYLTEHDTLSTTLNFYNDALKTKKGYTYAYRFGKTDANYFWKNINTEVFCDSTTWMTPLGYAKPNRVNFLRIHHGSGYLYIHTNPLVFTNYFMVNADKVEYASSVFSHLDGNDIIWDEFSRSQLLQNNAPEVNPMAYILQQDSLKYAWWLLLIAALLYTLFTAKRRQKVIPVLVEKTNTSLEFVKMISSLHFQNGNHRDIGRKRIKYFYYYIKMKYGIHIQNLAEANQARLAEKSKVESSIVQAVATEFDRLENQRFYDEEMLIDLQNSLESFYKNCK